jgi:hypothetical protein
MTASIPEHMYLGEGEGGGGAVVSLIELEHEIGSRVGGCDIEACAQATASRTSKDSNTAFPGWETKT